MEAQTKEILSLVRQLPPSEQEEILAELATSLSTADEAIERAWTEEAARRWARIESGEVETVSWADVRKKITEQLGL
jgi:putative addiction module component (TIGR02574 family)